MEDVVSLITINGKLDKITISKHFTVSDWLQFIIHILNKRIDWFTIKSNKHKCCRRVAYSTTLVVTRIHIYNTYRLQYTKFIQNYKIGVLITYNHWLDKQKQAASTRKYINLSKQFKFA